MRSKLVLFVLLTGVVVVAALFAYASEDGRPAEEEGMNTVSVDSEAVAVLRGDDTIAERSPTALCAGDRLEERRRSIERPARALVCAVVGLGFRVHRSVWAASRDHSRTTALALLNSGFTRAESHGRKS